MFAERTSSYEGLSPDEVDEKVAEYVALIRQGSAGLLGGPGMIPISATVTKNVDTRLLNLANLFDVSKSKMIGFVLLAGLSVVEDDAIAQYDAQVG